MDEATAQRIKILEQLMGVYRDLDEVPKALEAAYNEQNDSADEGVLNSLDRKVAAG